MSAYTSVKSSETVDVFAKSHKRATIELHLWESSGQSNMVQGST